jgi:transcriptional repressor NrdR
MKCPRCQIDKDRVIDSRASDDGQAIRRRRECLNCEFRYTTYERIEEPAVKIVKKDGVTEPYQREKIKRGLEKACWKRPVTDAQIDDIVAKVENTIRESWSERAEVPSKMVGEMVMDFLRELDQIAYVRFASVYRQFDDVEEFVKELTREQAG